jgi:hypothetical protein
LPLTKDIWEKIKTKLEVQLEDIIAEGEIEKNDLTDPNKE